MSPFAPPVALPPAAPPAAPAAGEERLEGLDPEEYVNGIVDELRRNRPYRPGDPAPDPSALPEKLRRFMGG